MSFHAIGGDTVQLPFPNIYEVAVYKQDPETPNRLVLKTKEEIKTTIRDYLSSKVQQYNTVLTTQLSQKDAFYNSNTSLFNKLGAVDVLATPNRSYTLLQPTLFNAMVSDEIVDGVAQLLYVENSIIPYKNKTATLEEEYEQFYNVANITNKKETLLKEYLTQQSPSSPLTLP